MFRPSRRLLHHLFTGASRAAQRVLMLALCGVAVMGTSSSLHADDVAEFLEHHGMKSLLARHYERQIEQAAPEDRGELILQLAAVYADLLETIADPQVRQDVENRSRALLEMAPAANAEELRLALLRTSYRVVEKIAERHRLRMASTEEVESARTSIAEITVQFAPLRQRLKHAVELADRRLSRSAGAQALQIGEAGDHAQRLYSQCTFINAWALYYQSWLNNREAEAREAESLFAELLLTESPFPEPHDVSVDLRANEAVARSILGMGLCKSITSSVPTAISWINLLDHENTYDALRFAAPGWKIAVYLEHGEYRQVWDFLDAAAPNAVLTPWWRLVAALCLEQMNSDRMAAELAQRAVLELATRGELSQVLDLASRYGAESLGQTGFALQYVHAVIKYQEARSVHGDDSPTSNDRIRSMYEQTAAHLRAALDESDVNNYPAAAASCRRLLAWCAYFRSEFLIAADSFEAAASMLARDDAAEALWMAIVALSKVAEFAPHPSIQSRLDQLSSTFINQFPASDHAATLRMRRALSSNEVSDAAVEDLLAIAPNSDMYKPARHRAADLLYQLFRASAGNDRHYRAGRFLQVALPLLADGALELESATGEQASDGLMTRCRQVLEVSLAEGIDRADAAREAFAVLERLSSAGVGAGSTDIAQEIECRRVQERLLFDDAPAAAILAKQLWDSDPESVWTRMATRAMFKYGYARWKDAEASFEARSKGLEMVAEYGGRVLREFRNAGEALDEPGALGYHVAVAEASCALWEMQANADRGKAALYLYERLLRARPRNASFLRSAAILSESVGEPSRALECWRRLAAGAELETDAWYEAKFRLIKLLATLDPPRAREVMDQHKQLNPEYGPSPWGGMLKGLDAQIGNAPTSASPVVESVDDES